jgi:hypothetical protein
MTSLSVKVAAWPELRATHRCGQRSGRRANHAPSIRHARHRAPAARNGRKIAAVEIEIAMLCPGAGSQQHDRAAKNAHRGKMDAPRRDDGIGVSL